MKNKLQILSILIIGLLIIGGVNNLWSADIPKTGCVNKLSCDTLPPVENSNDKPAFKKKFQYEKDGKINHIETEEQNIKIEYDILCHRQIKTTRINKSTGDSTSYTFTYDPSCQLAKGESSRGVILGFEFDSKKRLIAITNLSQKIRIEYHESGFAKKISLGNRGYMDNVYSSSGKIKELEYRGYRVRRPRTATWKVFGIMYDVFLEANILFNQLLEFDPGLDMKEILGLLKSYRTRPPWEMPLF